MPPVYPFGGHWSGYSAPGSSVTSSEVTSSSAAVTLSSSKKHGSLNHPLSTAASSASSQSWWCPPSLYPGMPTSEMLPFPSVPWSGHEHHESLSSARDSHASLYHGTHLRTQNGLMSSSTHGHGSSAHGHGYHRSHGSQLHSGTLIHFPHTGSHQPTLAKEDQPWVSSPNDPLPHSGSSTVSEFAQYQQKDQQAKIVTGDPLLSAATEGREKEKSKEVMSTISAQSLKDKELLEDISLYQMEEESSSLEGSEKTRNKHRAQLCQKEFDTKYDVVDKSSKLSKAELFEKSQLDKIERERTLLRASPSRVTGWNAPHERKSIHDSHIDNLTKYHRHVHPTASESKDLHPAIRKDFDAYSAKSHIVEDKMYPSYQSVPSTEMENTKHLPGIVSRKSHVHGREQLSAKHEHHREYEHQQEHINREPITSQQPQVIPGNLHGERMTKAQATQEWVNQHPAVHRSSPESFLKQDHRAKFPDADVKHVSPLNRKPDGMPSALRSPPARNASSKMEKLAKREQHYESPLNSSLPRYTATSQSCKPEQIKAPPMHPEKQQPFVARHHQSKHPFNVDFLSVSADSEKSSSNKIGQHRKGYSIPEGDAVLDRVSVIKTMPTVPVLNRDIASSTAASMAEKNNVHLPLQKDAVRVSAHRKGTSLLDSPLPCKPPVGTIPRMAAVAMQEDSSSKNSESSSSSSGEDSVDEEEEIAAEPPADDGTAKENGTENEGEIILLI